MMRVWKGSGPTDVAAGNVKLATVIQYKLQLDMATVTVCNGHMHGVQGYGHYDQVYQASSRPIGVARAGCVGSSHLCRHMEEANDYGYLSQRYHAGTRQRGSSWAGYRNNGNPWIKMRKAVTLCTHWRATQAYYGSKRSRYSRA